MTGQKKGWWIGPGSSSGNRRSVDYRRYWLSPWEWLLYGTWRLVVCGLTAYTSYRSITTSLILLPAGLLYPAYKKTDLKRERTRQLGFQLKEAILVLVSFLGAGYSLESGPVMSVAELEGLYGKEGMITREFTILSAGVRMNRQPEQFLMGFGSGSGLEDVDNFAQVLAAIGRSEGELVEIIHYMAGIIRDKVQVQEEVHTMTASRVFEQKVMNGISFLITLYIDFTSPGFFRVTCEAVMGRCTMTAYPAVYAGALVLAKKISEIEAQRIKT